MTHLRAIADYKKIIPYRKDLRAIAGSVTATILLQQFMYWGETKKYQPFYKFKEPCSHSLYKEGDSWTEELGFSAEEFDSALKRLAIKTTKTESKAAYQDNMIVYWTEIDRRTWYWVNPIILEKRLCEVFDCVGEPSDLSFVYRESRFSIPGSTVEINTENTTENTIAVTKNVTAAPPPKAEKKKPFALNFETDMSARLLKFFHDEKGLALTNDLKKLEQQYRCVQKWVSEAKNPGKKEDKARIEERVKEAIIRALKVFREGKLTDKGIYSYSETVINLILKIRAEGDVEVATW